MYIFVDCEASGPCPTYGDLIEFAAITENGVSFKSEKMMPSYENYDEGAYRALGITRDIHESYTGHIVKEIVKFNQWISELDAKGRLTFWSDNPAFDWQWINHGFRQCGIPNPFGFSARRIGDLYAGANGNIRDATSWKRWRVTKHTHDPLDDVKGNLEAFLEIRKKYHI